MKGDRQKGWIKAETIGYAKSNKWLIGALCMMGLSVAVFFLMVGSFSAARGLNLLFLLVAQATFGVGFLIHELIPLEKSLGSRAYLMATYLSVTTVLSILLIYLHESLRLSLLLHGLIVALFWLINHRISQRRFCEPFLREPYSWDQRLISMLQTIEEQTHDPEGIVEIRQMIQAVYVQKKRDPDELEKLVDGLAVALQGDDGSEMIEGIQRFLFTRDQELARRGVS